MTELFFSLQLKCYERAFLTHIPILSYGWRCRRALNNDLWINSQSLLQLFYYIVVSTLVECVNRVLKFALETVKTFIISVRNSATSWLIFSEILPIFSEGLAQFWFALAIHLQILQILVVVKNQFCFEWNIHQRIK